MASDFLRKLAEEQAEGIRETFGNDAYGSTAYIPRRVEEEARQPAASHQVERRGVTTPSTDQTRRENTPSRFLQEQAAQEAEREAQLPRLMLPTVDSAPASPMAARRTYSAPAAEREREDRRTYGLNTALPEGRYTQIEVPEKTARRTVGDLLSDKDTMARWQELASKDKLTAAEKQEARTARREINQALRGTIRGTGWLPDMSAEEIRQRNELGNLGNALELRSSIGSAFVAGAVDALGLDWLSDRIRGLGGEEFEEALGNPATMRESTAAARAAAPGAFTAGNIAGSLAEMIPISNAVSGALKGVEWFGKAAPWLQRAITSGITFGITGAQGAITEDKDLGGIALGAATGVLSGAAGGSLEALVGLGTSNTLVRYGLQFNPVFRALAGGLGGVGFSVGSTAVRELSNYLQYPEGYTASPQQIGTDLAIAFLFSTVSSALSEARNAPQNRESLLRMMDELAKEYGAAEMEMAGMTGEARRQAAQRVAEMTSRIRSSIATSRGMSGVSNEIKQLVAALDIIDDRMAAIIAGGNGLLGAADVMQAAQQMGGMPLALPSWSGAGSQGTNLEQAVQIIGANVPAPQGQAPAVPAWYDAYQASPRPIDRAALYTPSIPAPAENAPTAQPANVPESVETAPPAEIAQRGAERAAEGGELRGPDFTAWDNIYNQDRVTDLTPEEQRIIERMPTASETRTGGETLTPERTEGIVEEITPKIKLPEVEEAKQELKKAIRMPIKGKNVDALEQGARTGELTVDSVTVGGKVPGFTREQQTSLAAQIIEGTQNGQKEITAKVPNDGTFTVNNEPGSVAQVLNSLKVKANQDSIFTPEMDKILSGAKTVKIFTVGGENYVSNGAFAVAVGKSGAEYAAERYKATQGALAQTEKLVLDIAGNEAVLTEQPYIFEKNGRKVYVFQTESGPVGFDRKYVDLIGSGELHIGHQGYLSGKRVPFMVSVNPDGSILGFAVGLSGNIPEIPSVTDKALARGNLRGIKAAIQNRASAAGPDGATEGNVALSTVEEDQPVSDVARRYGLTYDEEKAIKDYKSSYSYKINAKLMELQGQMEVSEGMDPYAALDDYDRAFLDSMDRAMEKLPVYKGTVYRNLSFEDFGGEEAYNAFLEVHIPGNIVTNYSYTSSSRVPDGHPLEGSLVVNLVIKSEDGRTLTGFGNDSEREVLFKREKSFEVLRREKINGIETIFMQEVTNGQGSGSEGGEGLLERPAGLRLPDVQQVQASDSGSKMQGVSGGDSAGDSKQAGQPQGTLSGGSRNSVRGEGLALPTAEADSEEAALEKLALPSAEATEEEDAPVRPSLPTAEGKAHEVLTDAITREIQEGNTITSKRLMELAEKAFGGTRGSGAYDMKTAYDALELGVNKYLMDADFVKESNGDAATAVRTEKTLQQIMSQLPTQNIRTEEQQQFQQFSTPPNIAYLAAWVANIREGDVALEPSAGIGGLALWPKAWGATVFANELSGRRAEILRSLGLDEVFTENAEQINNILPEWVKPTVVLMNPPFSSTAGRTSTNNTANAKRHVEQALLRLEDGGRLVAVLGRGMANDSKTFAPWWNDLRKKYDIRANLSIDGRNYTKYGTSFDVQMVVIDKTGPQAGETITGNYDDLTEIPQVLEGIRNDRTQLETRTGNAGERGVRAHAGSERNGPVFARPAGNDQRPSGNSSGNVGNRASESAGDRGRVQPGGAGENGLRIGNGDNGQRVGDRGGQTAGSLHPESESKRGSGSEPELSLPRVTDKPAKAAKPTGASSQKAGNDDGVYAEYIPPKTQVKGTKKHPAQIVESAAMAAVDAPQATYVPNIPKELITSGVLSDVQLTNIVYAGQAHSQMIPNQNIRRGYFIGDGTGVGKGRQITGIILDNFRQGRTKAVWVSQRQNLLPDAKRDWKAMGMSEKDILSTGKIKTDKAIEMPSGILFTTYDTLATKSRAGNSRIDQIVNWLGPDFDGVIAMDEAHTMGNLLGKKGKRGNSKPAEHALAGAELQKRLPNARIVYASATIATDVSEMAFAERLGLWGPGTQFNNVRDFVEQISSGGMAAMELVARDMKAMGLYQARSISYNGVQYDTIQHDLTPMQKEIYNTMSRAWQVTLKHMNEALEMTGASLNSRAKSSAKSAYYNAMQRFYNQILTSMAMPSVIEDIKKELAAGRSCVLQIVNTNEAETNRQLAKVQETGGDLEDLDITPRENLVGFFRNAFPVQVYEEYTDDNGNKRSRPVTDSKGNPVLDKKAVALRDRMIAEIEAMSVPEGPMEMLFDAFGTDQVAEVTGRKRRVVPGKDEYGNTVRVEEKRGSGSGEADAQTFQDGKKHILVFSDAGGTGKSYHADRTAKNQEQRVHYLIQAGWSAPKAVQGFGRTNRSNQASAPIYKLVTTDVKGQKRFISTIARRLDQLGALTKGQRQTGSGVFSARDNLESDLATDTLYNFYQALVRDQIEGLDPQSVLDKLGLMDKFTDKETGRIKVPDGDGWDMSLFLNRILALEYDEQNMVFDAFNRMLDDAYETALANGTLDMGMETVRADKIDIVDDMTVREDPETGVATNYVQAKLSEKARIVKTVDDLKALRGDFVGLYKKKNGETVGVFRTKDKTETNGNVVKQYILQSPLERKFSRYVEATLKKDCERVPEREWNKAWKEEVEKTPEYTETIKHMLTGSLLPIWNKLPQSGNVRVQRLIADDGRQYLGRIIDPSQIDSVLKSLGVSEGRTKQTYTADDVIKRVLKDGDKATLENNRIALTRRRVGGEMRIEITGDNLWYLMRTNPDIISETINYRPRYFLPTGEKQKQALENLLKENPVQDITQMRGGDDEVSNMVDSERNFNGNSAPRHPENWTAERVGDKDKQPMSLPDIVNMLRHDFDIPVSTGNIRSPQSRAQYLTQPQSVRSKVANSIPDIAHELGHHLDNLYDLQHSVSKAAKDEIVNALPADFAAKYKDRELPGEGVAEFLRRYLQNSETAEMDYPIFSAEFFSRIKPKDRAALDKLADEVNAYYSLSQDTGNWPVHNREDRGRDYRDVGEKIKDLNTHFRTLFIDSMEPIKRIDEATGGKVHLFATNSAYAGNRAYAAITRDLYDLRGNPLGDGLQKVLKDIHLNNRREYSDFGMYLICRHGPERLAEGMRVFADDAWDNTAWMEARAEELAQKYPQFEEAADRLEEFQKQVLQAYGVDSGLYSQETVDAWHERWEHYVPLNRWFGDKDGSAKRQKRGFANQTGPYRKAVGSGRDIVHPVDNILENTVRLITTSIYNDVMQKITRAVAGTEGLGWLMEQVPMPLARKTWDGKGLKSKTLDAFDAYFNDAGKSLDEKQMDLIQTILDGAIDDLLVQYGRGKAHGDVVTVMKGGKPQYWKVNDPDLLRSITNMGPSRASSILNYLGRINRFITGNITGMNVVWSVASNMPRDIGTMFTFSKTKNVVKLLAGIGESYWNTVRKSKASELFKEFMAMGGNSTSAQTADKDMAKKARKALQRHVSDYLNPLAAVDFISDMIERGPRYSYYKICRTKYDMTPEEAFYAAGEITVNFKRAGLLSREINMVIPFFNASIQGVDRAARWLAADEAPQKDKNKVRAGRITAFVGASLVIAALSMLLNTRTKKKRDDLEKLSNFTKNTYFVIPMKNGKYLAIPKPRELAIPISLFERIMETYLAQNPHAMDDFWEYASDNLLPGVISGAAQGDLNSAIGDLGVVGTIHYLVSNQDFLGRPIVSSALQKVEPRDQYNGSTSKLAKLIGQAFNLSPQQIDFIGNDIMGGFWSWQKALFPVSGEGDLSLGVKGKWIKDPLYSTDIANRMYDERDRLEQVKNSHPGDVNSAIRYRTANDTATFYGRYYRLARNEEDVGADAKSREVRTAVLDMILGVERGEKADEGAYRFMVEALNYAGNAELMPAVMDVTVKADSGKVYDLTSEEYFDLQTRYLSLYYNYVRGAMDRKPGMNLDEKVSTLEAAKRIAGIVARGETVKALGGKRKDYQKILDLREDGVEVGELVSYLAAKDLYGADGEVTNVEILGAAAGLRLPTINEQAALVGYSNESLGLKLRSVGEFDVDARDYQKVLNALGDANLSKTTAEAAIDEAYGPTTNANRAEKAAMWQALNKGWNAANNPYDTGVSAEVKDRLRLPVS